MSDTDREADENSLFTGEMPSVYVILPQNRIVSEVSKR
jgi:hypothetical protein